MRHIILKQVMQLKLGEGVEAFGTQHAVSRWFMEVMVPLLERVFDELAGEGVVIRCDRLSLDLGVLTEQQIRRNIPDPELYVLIREQLRRILGEEKEEMVVRRVTNRVSVFEQWWYYMEKGRLPWNAGPVDAGWWRLVLETLSVDYESARRTRVALAEQPVFLQRVSRQHTDEFLETLTGILIGMKQESLGHRVEEAVVLSGWLEKKGREAGIGGGSGVGIDEGRGDEEARWIARSLLYWMKGHAEFLSLPEHARKTAVWELVLREVAGRTGESRAVGITTLLSQWISEDEQIHILLKEAGLSSPLVRMPGRRESHREREDAESDRREVESRQAKGNVDEEDGRRRDAGEEERISRQGKTGKKVEEPGDDRERASDQTRGDGMAASKDEGREERLLEEGDSVWDKTRRAGEIERVFDRSQVEEEGLFGEYAGLILVHPFLSTFFSRCGLTEHGVFVNRQARHQAVYLLYYLATGEKDAPEHALLFPKLYCGCDLEAALSLREEQPESSYEEADQLLQMVLQRWEKLQQSSAAALREGFLRRVGKMVNRNDRLVLLIEASAIDVLLDYLPWNLSIVKLPWLKDLLYVEWR